MARITKYWKAKAESLSKYVEDDYNEGRALLATLGSAGILTFEGDLRNLVEALRSIGDDFLADKIEKRDWLYKCGKNFRV